MGPLLVEGCMVSPQPGSALWLEYLRNKLYKNYAWYRAGEHIIKEVRAFLQDEIHEIWTLGLKLPRRLYAATALQYTLLILCYIGEYRGLNLQVLQQKCS